MKKRNKYLLAIASIFMIGMISFFIYVNQYYPPGEEAIAAAAQMEQQEKNYILKNNSDTGFIIYPGGKVDERAYAVLAEMLYKKGHTVIIAKMPFRLSILNSMKAGDIIQANPEISHWYMIGHSLGGTSVSIYLEKNHEQVDGAVFLGSYAYKDLSDTDLSVLIITGEQDQVLDREAAREAVSNYPAGLKEYEIAGGNHSGFGCYGLQKGDGTGTLSWFGQHELTVEAILRFVHKSTEP